MNDISSFIGDIRLFFKNHGLLMVLFLLVQFTISTKAVHMYFKDAFCIIVLISFFTKYLYVPNAKLLSFFCLINYLLMLFGGIINSQFETLSLLVGPIAYFLFGYHIMRTIRNDMDFELFLLLTVISSSSVLWYNNIVDSLDVGFINLTRTILDADGIEENSATLQGLVASIAIIGISYPISRMKYMCVRSFFFIFSSLMSLFCVVHLVNRTGLVIVVLIALLSVIYTYRPKLITFISLFIIAIVVYVFLLNFSIISDDIIAAYSDRDNFEGQSVDTAGGRTIQWANAFSLMIEYPFGWRKSVDSGFCHNLWLDEARCVGVIPAFILFLFSISQYKNTLKLFKWKNNYVNCILVCFNAGFFMSAFVEPIMEALSTYFFLMCLVWGMQQCYIQNGCRIVSMN